MLATFLLGIAWMFLIGIQTRLLIKTKSLLWLGLWVAGTSVVWGLVVLAIQLDSRTIVPYSVGTGIGAMLAYKLGQLRGA